MKLLKIFNLLSLIFCLETIFFALKISEFKPTLSYVYNLSVFLIVFIYLLKESIIDFNSINSKNYSKK